MQMVRFKSAADYVTAELQRMILQGQLKPNERLDQIELAARLDVSRHPIRQAIERLAERGFIELRPHRSAVVAGISLADMDELYRARIELECLALREGWPNFNAAVRSRIAGLHAEMRRLDIERDFEAFMEVNRAFHLAMYAPCGNRHIIRAVTSLYDLSERYQRVGLQSAQRQRQSAIDHAAIVEAIEAGDLSRVLELIRMHNEGTQEAVRAYLRNQEDSPK